MLVLGRFVGYAVDAVVIAVPENWHERRIGSEHDENRYLDGMIDEVRVYDRILDANEVEQNFGVLSNDTTAVEPDSKLATTWSSIKISH